MEVLLGILILLFVIALVFYYAVVIMDIVMDNSSMKTKKQYRLQWIPFYKWKKYVIEAYDE